MDSKNQRLKDDEVLFLQALRLGTAGTARLSPTRRTALQAQFERKGWTKDGKLTHLGQHMADTNPTRKEESQPPIADVIVAGMAEATEERKTESDERQPDGSDVESLVQGPPAKRVDSSP